MGPLVGHGHRGGMGCVLQHVVLGIPLAPGEEFTPPADPRRNREVFVLRRGGALERVLPERVAAALAPEG